MDNTPNQPAETGYEAPPVQVASTAGALPSLSRQAYLVRIGLIGIAAAALVAAALLVFSSTATPTGTLAAGTTDNGTTNGSVDILNGGGPGFRDGGPGFRDGGPFGLGGITITAINGNSISLTTVDGWTRTITVDSGTSYTKAGATIALSDLKVGDQIGFRETRENNGSWTIDSIVVIPPHAGGEVTKISGSTITVSQRDGTTTTITVNDQTKYTVNRDSNAKLSDIKVGMFLIAEGSRNSDGSLTASQVKAATITVVEGRGGRFGRGFPGFVPDWNGEKPDSSAAPASNGSAG
jgi:Domain of unknown function (DUF5666)